VNGQISREKTTFCAPFELFVNLVWAIAFFAMVKKTNSTDCQGPTWFWSHYAEWQFLIAAIIALIGMILPYADDKKDTKKRFSGFLSASLTIHSVLSFLSRLNTFVLSIGIIVSFAHIDQCSPLHDLIMAILILFMIIYGVIALSCPITIGMICFVIYSGNSKMAFQRIEARIKAIMNWFLSPKSLQRVQPRSLQQKDPEEYVEIKVERKRKNLSLEGNREDLNAERKRSDLSPEGNREDLNAERKRSDLSPEGNREDLNAERKRSDLSPEGNREDLKIMNDFEDEISP